MLDPEGSGKRMAKLQTTPAGGGEKGKEEEWVEMKVGPVKRVLECVFGMVFPSDYSSN